MSYDRWKLRSDLDENPPQEYRDNLDDMSRAQLMAALREAELGFETLASQCAQEQERLEEQIAGLVSLCARAADALSMWAKWPQVPELIAELRKATE
jgi:HPt (histidine-containing phosphotransfer) domain-containing protein